MDDTADNTARVQVSAEPPHTESLPTEWPGWRLWATGSTYWATRQRHLSGSELSAGLEMTLAADTPQELEQLLETQQAREDRISRT